MSVCADHCSLNTVRKHNKLSLWCVFVVFFIRYIDNVCNNPTEEKYHKIRVGNKAYTEKVASLEGSHEFLQAVGFFPRMLPHQGQSHSTFIVFAPNGFS